MTAGAPLLGAGSTPPGGDEPKVDPAEAWKVLGLVNDWVRHAEAKAGATLAALGVTGGALYNLVKSQQHVGHWLAFVATLCGIAVVVGGVFAVLALRPRLRSHEAPTSTLYFDHIARKHTGTTSTDYEQDLTALVATPNDLVGQIGQQIWSNARVARAKYQWSAWAIISLAVGLASIAAVAVTLGLTSLGE